jgi:hypothetical protein
VTVPHLGRSRGARHAVPLAAVLVAASLVVLGACTDDEATSPTTVASPATTVATTASTSAPTTDTTSAPTTSATEPPPPTIAYDPGEPCTLGTNPDCIDPNETGEGVFLIGGADCMAAARQNDSSTAICIDLDRDGRAGYPDRG